MIQTPIEFDPTHYSNNINGNKSSQNNSIKSTKMILIIAFTFTIYILFFSWKINYQILLNFSLIRLFYLSITALLKTYMNAFKERLTNKKL